MAGKREWKPSDVADEKSVWNCQEALVRSGGDPERCRTIIEGMVAAKCIFVAAILTHPSEARFPHTLCIARIYEGDDDIMMLDAWSLSSGGWYLAPINRVEFVGQSTHTWREFLTIDMMEKIANPVEARAMEAYIGGPNG